MSLEPRPELPKRRPPTNPPGRHRANGDPIETWRDLPCTLGDLEFALRTAGERAVSSTITSREALLRSKSDNVRLMGELYEVVVECVEESFNYSANQLPVDMEGL